MYLQVNDTAYEEIDQKCFYIYNILFTFNSHYNCGNHNLQIAVNYTLKSYKYVDVYICM